MRLDNKRGPRATRWRSPPESFPRPAIEQAADIEQSVMRVRCAASTASYSCAVRSRGSAGLEMRKTAVASWNT